MSRVPLNSHTSTASDRQTSIRPAGLNDEPAAKVGQNYFLDIGPRTVGRFK